MGARERNHQSGIAATVPAVPGANGTYPAPKKLDQASARSGAGPRSPGTRLGFRTTRGAGCVSGTLSCASSGIPGPVLGGGGGVRALQGDLVFLGGQEALHLLGGSEGRGAGDRAAAAAEAQDLNEVGVGVEREVDSEHLPWG